MILFRYSDGNTYTDYRTREQAEIALQRQNGGTIREVHARQKFARVKLQCNECGKRFAVSPNAADPQCPGCGSVDWDVIY